MTAAILRVQRSVRDLVFAAILFALMIVPARAAGYENALKGVTAYQAVYEVSLGDPKLANLVFWAVRNSYQVDALKALSQEPDIAIVFHGPAVKLISSNEALFNGAELAEVTKFQDMLRQMKQDGVTLEVCDYAIKVVGIDKNTIIPEVDHVGNGFVSVIGYQMQGYAVVRIP